MRGSVRHGQKRSGVVALATALGLGLGLGGCTAQPLGQSRPGTQSPADASVTDARAGYVQLMLGNAQTSGPLTEETPVAVISQYGGGYVTSATASGTMGTAGEELVLDTVLGPGTVSATVQGESYLGPSAMRCYRFTVGFYGEQAQHTAMACPRGLTFAEASVQAQREEAAEQIVSRGYGGGSSGPGAGMALPTDLAQAESLFGIARLPGFGVPLPTGGTVAATGGAATGSATGAVVRSAPSPSAAAPSPSDSPRRTSVLPSPPRLAAAAFAAGPGIAALAVPLQGLGCVYFRVGVLGPADPSAGAPGSLDVSSWPAPTTAACTGRAALATAGYISSDPHAGG